MADTETPTETPEGVLSLLADEGLAGVYPAWAPPAEFVAVLVILVAGFLLWRRRLLPVSDGGGERETRHPIRHRWSWATAKPAPARPARSVLEDVRSADGGHAADGQARSGCPRRQAHSQTGVPALAEEDRAIARWQPCQGSFQSPASPVPLLNGPMENTPSWLLFLPMRS